MATIPNAGDCAGAGAAAASFGLLLATTTLLETFPKCSVIAKRERVDTRKNAKDGVSKNGKNITLAATRISMYSSEDSNDDAMRWDEGSYPQWRRRRTTTRLLP